MSAAQPTLYDILGVTPTADQAEIRTAYRELARRFHPDYNPDDEGAEGAFKAVTRAYEVLSDPERRARYDKALDDQSKAGRVTAGPTASRSDTVMMVVFIVFLILAVFFFFFDPARGVFFLVIAVALELRNSVEALRKGR